MNKSLIKWTRSDAQKLSSAVRKFNNKIRKIRTEENKLYLPKEIEYKELKSEILNRKDLTNKINSLREFLLDGAEDLYTTESGMKLTIWERLEIEKATNFLTKKYDKELKEEMEGKQWETVNARIIKRKQKKLNQIENLTGFDFNSLKNRILKQGNRSYELYKAEIYRQNYYEALQGIKNFKNYEIFIEKLNRIKNPIKFFEYIQQSEILSDLFLWYDDKSGTLHYGGFISNEDAFDSALVDLRIIEEE